MSYQPPGGGPGKGPIHFTPDAPYLPLPQLPPPPAPAPLGATVGRWVVLAALGCATPAWVVAWTHAALTEGVPVEWLAGLALPGAAGLGLGLVVVGIPFWIQIRAARHWNAAATTTTQPIPAVWASLIAAREGWTARYGGPLAPEIERETRTVEVDADGRPVGKIGIRRERHRPAPVVDGQAQDVTDPPPSPLAEAVRDRLTRWIAGERTQPLARRLPVAYTADMQAIVAVAVLMTPSVRNCCGDPPRPFRAKDRARYQLARDTLYAYGILQPVPSSRSFDLVPGLRRPNDTIQAVHRRIAAILDSAPDLTAAPSVARVAPPWEKGDPPDV